MYLITATSVRRSGELLPICLPSFQTVVEIFIQDKKRRPVGKAAAPFCPPTTRANDPRVSASLIRVIGAELS